MRILIIGSGGREHALIWKLSQSPQVEKIFVAPGNGGTEAFNVSLDPADFEAIREFCQREGIDLVVPGPELPLTRGLVDFLQEAGISCFGPDKYCARLEGSKSFAKKIMREAGVPTARSGVFTDAASAADFVRSLGGSAVIKADGLAAGKGVIVANTEEEALEAIDAMLNKGDFGEAGKTIVVEEKLQGEEVSLLCFCDGETARPLASAQDHKAAHDGDLGPNTGGMGAYSPAPILPDDKLEEMTDLVIRPILKRMRELGHPFVGVLYAGLMLTAAGPRVLEYNVRFGDPECQPLMMRLEGDLAEIMLAALRGELAGASVEFSSKPALGVVLAANGYPGEYPRGMPINGLDKISGQVSVFHAGTRRENGEILANGGRVLCVTAMGEDLAEAQENAYQALAKINMPGAYFRKDIGSKGIERLARAKRVE